MLNYIAILGSRYHKDIDSDVDYSQQHYKNLELLVVQGPGLLKLDVVRFFEDNTTQLVDHI